MIKLENVGFRYEDMVMNFDLQVAKGELIGIVGPSGAGKSTLLSLIAGFDLPISGRISIAGVDMKGVTPDQRPVSMIFRITTVLHISMYGPMWRWAFHQI